MVEWLGLHALTVEGPGSITGGGTKVPQAVRRGQKKKKEVEYWQFYTVQPNIML